MLWISSSESPEPDLISIFCSLPVPRSLAVTWMIPLGSMWKVTSIWGSPRGAGGIPVSWNLPRLLLPLAISRSPCRTGLSALAPPNLGLDRGLVGLGGREGLGLLGRDRRVALDQLRHHAAFGLDPKGQRGDVEQQHVLDVASQHAGLDPGADRDHLVGVDPLVRLLAGQLFHLLAHRRHPGHAADQDD